jgi:glycosyltransferase involved in cell wall biosynthesis
MIIDGGSTDGSVEIIKQYEHLISHWTSRQDNGQAEAINEGFKKASGKYVAWLNSDDVYLPGCIQKAVEVLEANPQAAMAFGQVEVVNEDGERIAEFRPITYRFEDLLTYKIILPQQAAFFRRTVLDEIGDLDTSLHFALDHEFFLRIGMRHTVIGIPEFMAQYRISNINKGSTSRSKWAEEFIQVLDRFYLRPEADEKFSQLMQPAYAGAYYHGACSLLDDGLYFQARQWYGKTIKHRFTYLFQIRWWVGVIRTFLERVGNSFYLDLKVWLAKKSLLDIRYDWWTALKMANNKTRIH